MPQKNRPENLSTFWFYSSVKQQLDYIASKKGRKKVSGFFASKNGADIITFTFNKHFT